MTDEQKDDVVAFLLLLTISEKTEDILKNIREIAEVVEAHIIYGDWDMIVKVKIKNLPDLTKIVMKLRKVEGVQKTNTLITLNN